MSEISEWESRLLARQLRIAALKSLGRTAEAEGLPILRQNPTASTSAPARGVKFAPRTAKAQFGSNSRVSPARANSKPAATEQTGTFHWVDRANNIAIIIPDGGGQHFDANLPSDFPSEGGLFSEGQKVAFTVKANAGLTFLQGGNSDKGSYPHR